MGRTIHLICRRRLRIVDKDPSKGLAESSSWCFSLADSRLLPGAIVMFHEAKAKASYEGGVIKSVTRTVEPVEDSAKRRTRFTFEFVKRDATLNQAWAGANHQRAWYSGILGGE